MKTQSRARGLIASLGAVIVAGALSLSGAAAAQAATVPDASGVVITKLKQPDAQGAPATGAQMTQLPSEGIAGMQFELFQVTGTGKGETNDIGTAKGQQFAASLKKTANATLTTPAKQTGITQANGQLSIPSVARGLYVVKESTTPATPAGVTAGADFFLAVPLTDPANSARYLDTIYVYPKSSSVGAAMSVKNADRLVVGDTVTWTTQANIPRIASDSGSPRYQATDLFEIVNTFDTAKLGATADGVKLTGPAGLERTTDYTVELRQDGADKTSAVVTLTAAGRQKLADALNADPAAQVTMTVDTTVKRADAITNDAKIYPDAQAKANGKPIALSGQVKYGSYRLNKQSSDTSVTDLSGAQFRVYKTKQAAQAAGGDYLKPQNSSGQAQDLWTTNAQGRVTIEGLRYSGFADGQTVARGSAGYQSYWLVETKALKGHQLLAEPVEIVIDGDTATQTAQTIVNVPTTGGFNLPLTGGVGTASLTAAGIALLSLVVIAARRRRDAAHAE